MNNSRPVRGRGSAKLLSTMARKEILWLGRLQYRWALYLHNLLRRTSWPLVSRRADGELRLEWQRAIVESPNGLLRAGAKCQESFHQSAALPYGLEPRTGGRVEPLTDRIPGLI